MKRTKIAALICVVVACVSLALAGCQSGEYTPSMKEQSVSNSALGQAGTLRIGVNASSAPLAGKADDGAIVGIDADAGAFIADQMGLKVSFVDVGSDPAAGLSSGAVDIVLGVDASEDESTFWRSSPYLQTGVALYGTAAESAIPTTDSKPTIAAQSSSKSAWRVTNLFGDDSLAAQDDLKSAFDVMDKGAARYVAADAVVGTYVADRNSYSAKVLALLQDPSGYCVAVASSNAELQGAVTSALDKLVNGGAMNVIERKWLGTTLNLADVSVIKAASESKDKKKDKKES